MDPRTAATPPDPADRTDGAGPPPPQNRSSISSLLFLTFILFLITSGGSEDASIVSRQYRNALTSLKYQQSNYTAWLNGTESNFTLSAEDPTLAPFAHSLIPATSPLDGQTSYYHNISGYISGPSHFHNLSTIPLLPPETPTLEPSPTSWHLSAEQYVAHANINVSEVAERIGTYNWTGIDKATISMLEIQPNGDEESAIDSPEELILMRGKLDFNNPSESVELRFQIDGVHFPRNGTFVGFAVPRGRYSDIRELASLVPPHVRNATARAVVPELDRRIAKLRRMVEGGSSDVDSNSNDEIALPTCDFTFHFQMKPSPVPPHLMQELESELENPTGVSTVRAPHINLDAVLLSKDCAIMIEVRDAKGLKVQRFWRKATTYAGCSFVVYLSLLVLLARQVESDASRTPAGLSRVSRWSFVAQAGADAISFVGHLTFGIFSENRASLSLIAPGFLACILLVYQTQYAILINQIQGPEDAALRETSPPVSIGETDRTTIAPTQLRASPMTNFIGVIRSRLTAEPQTRFWFLVVASMLFFFNLIFSPFLALFAVGAIYSLLWAPQIIRSARRGSRPALNKDYLVGSTVGRTFFALYVFACPENVLGVEPSPYVWLIVGLISFQVLVIFCQDWFGPSFFLPKDWVTVNVYDYHPPMPVVDSEAPKQSLGDCSICMEAITIHPEISSSVAKAASATLISPPSAGLRRLYAVAPCHHIFHTNCLEQWLAIKNICPQCRRPLPPL